jgi:hypothetical protein
MVEPGGICDRQSVLDAQQVCDRSGHYCLDRIIAGQSVAGCSHPVGDLIGVFVICSALWLFLPRVKLRVAESPAIPTESKHQPGITAPTFGFAASVWIGVCESLLRRGLRSTRLSAASGESIGWPFPYVEPWACASIIPTVTSRSR